MSGPAAREDVRVEVLGALTVRHGDQVLSGHELGGRRARVTLVALALTDGPVSADRLAALIWTDDPPPTWPDALRGVIRSLRATLARIGAGGQRVIATTPSGYRLGDGVSVDLRSAAGTLAAAESLLGQERAAAALALAEPVAALAAQPLLPGEEALWLTGPRREAEDTALRALLITADAAGRAGDQHRAILAARRATTRAPLDERSHRALIRALHRAGDRAGVVAAYEHCRSALAEELGVDPDRETIDAYLAALGDASGQQAARLPQPASAYVGRAEETEQLLAALRAPGLITVTGRGGVGKSRLAVQAAGLASWFAGEVRWVSLAAAGEDELVAATVALALGLPVGTEDATALLAAELAPLGRALLILDGCEPVVDGAASLAASLLAACPQLTVTATSRTPLRVEAERVLPLDPLPPVDAHDPAAFRASAQVRLLADRVRHGGGRLPAGEQAAPLIAEVCRRCDGLPLALELAAAQLTAISVADLLDHLPGLLSDGEDRLRSLARSSYDLLDPDEASVFRRFALLDGPVTLPFARAVVAGGAVTPVRVVRILRELVSRGLLTVDQSGPRWRYAADDDLRRFGRELLAGSGEEPDVRGQLAAAVSAIVPADPKAPPGPHLDAISEILPAIRSLLSATVAGRLPAERGLDLAFRLHRFWAASNVAEGRFWLSRLLAEAPPSLAAAHAMYALGYLGYWSGDADAAVRELTAAAEQLRGQADDFEARALIYLGGLADDLDRGPDAVEFVRRSIAAAAPFSPDLQVAAAIGMGCVLAERADPGAVAAAADAISLCRERGSAEQLTATLATAAMVCWQAGDLTAARSYIAEAMPVLAGSRRIATVVLLSAAAGLAHADGDLAAAADLAGRAGEIAADLGIGRELPLIRCVAARASLGQGRLADAAAQTAAAITAARGLTFTFPLATCLETAALVCLERDQTDPAVVRSLLAAAAAIRARGDRPGIPSLQAAVAAAAQDAGVEVPAAALTAADAAAAATAALTALRQPGSQPCAEEVASS